MPFGRMGAFGGFGRLGIVFGNSGNGGLPAPPTGFAYLLGKDGAFLLGKDGAFLLGVVSSMVAFSPTFFFLGF